MKISFVIPVYNDWKSLEKLIHEIKLNLDSDKWTDITLIIVNDGSNNKFEKLINNSFNFEIKIINLISNQGSQKSIYVGLSYLNTLNNIYDYAIVMDSDGEDKPEDIEKVIDKAIQENKEKIIFASRFKRTESFTFIFLYNLYKVIFKILTGKTFNFGNFSCIPKSLIKSVIDLPFLFSHYAASILSSKIPHETIPCQRGKRYAGISKMKIHNLVLHGIKSLLVYYKIIPKKFRVSSYKKLVREVDEVKKIKI